MGYHEQYTLISYQKWGGTGVDAGEGQQGGTVGCSRSLCDVGVLSYTGSVNVSRLLGRKSRTGHQMSKVKQRNSNHIASHSKEAASRAKLWSFGRLLGSAS